MIVVSLAAAFMGAFFGFISATFISEKKNVKLEAETKRTVDLTMEGLKRLGMIGVSIEMAQDIVDMLDTHVPDMLANLDKESGTIFFEASKVEDVKESKEWMMKEVSKVAELRAKKEVRDL